MKIFNYNGKKLCDYIVYTNEYNKHIAIFRDANNKIQEVEISDIIKEALCRGRMWRTCYSFMPNGGMSCRLRKKKSGC